MMTYPSYLHTQADTVMLSIKVQPRASKNEIGKTIGNELKIKVTAPPVDAAANEALIKLLAERIGCSRNQVEIVRGHNSRHKVLRLHGLSSERVMAALSSASI